MEAPQSLSIVAKPQVSFGIAKPAYTKLTKLPSLTNWHAKKNKRKNNCLTIEYWTAVGPAEMDWHRHYKGHAGVGFQAGVKTNQVQKFEQRMIDVVEVCFDEGCDSWILKDKEDKFYRVAWPNAYRNENHPHHASRKEVDDIMASCTGVTIY